MAEQDFRERPLIVSECGVLMPESHGFPPEVVSSFLIETLDTLLSARDPMIGFPADDNRLVQAVSWYSAADSPIRPLTSSTHRRTPSHRSASCFAPTFRGCRDRKHRSERRTFAPSFPTWRCA
jgi:hypothetical protein